MLLHPSHGPHPLALPLLVLSMSPPAPASPHTRTDYLKLRQARLLRQAPPARSALFARLTFYVDSVRSTHQSKLRRLLHQHGALVHSHYSARALTHVLADNMAASKLARFSAATSGPLLVRPQWVLRCVARNALVPTSPFRLVRPPPSVAPITNYFTAAAKPKPSPKPSPKLSPKLSPKPIKPEHKPDTQ